ncbi:MAG: SIMPL domain-containing protein [Sulfuricurvum sp.]|uniref:SIMPL domain-containing protein n=1 Tax=Sulfuricurvum sp. TaxID=2025608 RepID=UPI0025D6F6D7|nr:SIMPL domain-containing protein [Sulfuricurvum sp.]MBV5321508.1 SIMPL domain-containing protein [Sulfuricurvum sp.]
MTQTTLIMALLSPLWVNAAMTIIIDEQVSHSLKPDALQVSLSFEEQSKNADTIKKHLNAIVTVVKGFDPHSEFCQGGGYQLSPYYSYKDQKREFIAYSGILNFGCEFKTVEEYNALIAKLDKASTPSVHKTEGELSWVVSEKNQNMVKQLLRLELLRTAKTQADSFSKETGMECNLESVNFGGVMQPRPMMMKTMMAESVPTESPIQRDEKSSLNATVSYSCLKRLP